MDDFYVSRGVSASAAFADVRLHDSRRRRAGEERVESTRCKSDDSSRATTAQERRHSKVMTVQEKRQFKSDDSPSWIPS